MHIQLNFCSFDLDYALYSIQSKLSSTQIVHLSLIFRQPSILSTFPWFWFCAWIDLNFFIFVGNFVFWTDFFGFYYLKFKSLVFLFLVRVHASIKILEFWIIWSWGRYDSQSVKEAKRNHSKKHHGWPTHGEGIERLCHMPSIYRVTSNIMRLVVETRKFI